MYETTGAEPRAAAENLEAQRDTACPGVLLRGGEVEEHVTLDHCLGGVVNGHELVVGVGGDVVEGDLVSAFRA